MAKVKAIVEGNIPANRLLHLYRSKSEDVARVGLPTNEDEFVDFVSTGDLKDGEEINVNIPDSGNRIWEVEAEHDLYIGDNVAVTNEGKIKLDSTFSHIGYVIASAKAGEVATMVKSPKIKSGNLREFIQNAVQNEVSAQTKSTKKKSTKKKEDKGQEE